MKDLHVITPVKDSLETTRETIEAIARSTVSFPYFIYNDFSGPTTQNYLEKHQEKLNYKLINLEELTDQPSPNYKLTLQKAQENALAAGAGLLIIESDVIVSPTTIKQLSDYANRLEKCGMVAAVTVDHNGAYNFPYNHVKANDPEVMNTDRSLSFCCTLLTPALLKAFDFQTLSKSKDWYDIFISRTSKRLGFNNYLIRSLKVLHQPHSSRPWKQLKYEKPLKYYFQKFFKGRDRI